MRACLCIVIAVGSAGCVASESIGKDLADGGDAGTGTDGGESTTTGGSESSDTTTGETDPCEAQDGDSTCIACQKTHCCPAWEACHAEDRCVCITVCYFEGHSLDACINTCGMDGGEHGDLITCTEGHCPDQCP